MEERSGITEVISYLGYPGFSERRGQRGSLSGCFAGLIQLAMCFFKMMFSNRCLNHQSRLSGT